MSDDEEWVPHRRDTWPWRYGRLKRAVVGSVYQGYWHNGEPVMQVCSLPCGTLVKIVMVSRFGDVGVTDQLTAETGYCARVRLDDLERAPSNEG